ncbi:hypothetical protein D6817_02755 [Candidatus Pacearchaeota archaeon]|nr:MAG: hypothetical protein D6817_02755 [Candidatus Pacearchaeota archaeon]
MNAALLRKQTAKFGKVAAGAFRQAHLSRHLQNNLTKLHRAVLKNQKQNVTPPRTKVRGFHKQRCTRACLLTYSFACSTSSRAHLKQTFQDHKMSSRIPQPRLWVLLKVKPS